uniref:F-box domain-containing protein n=1 Tax=Fagus sylvatica TaxID=28930 RepID=A0A2N9FLX7_FAGSY
MVLSALIPDELIMDILSRLPVQSLVKFLCVNKSWRSLITDDPAFKALNFHLHSSDTNSNYLITIPNEFSSETRLCTVIFRNNNNNGEVSNFVAKEIEIPFRTPTHFYRVLCSCNGVVCMSGCGIYTNIIDSLYLWNPSVRNFKMIGSCTPPGDTNIMITRHGIGVDHRDHDVFLLIIRIIFYYDVYEGTYNGEKKPYTEVYSLNTNSWSRIHESVVVPCLASDQPTAFVNGAIHWKALSFSSRRCVIMYFNTSERVFGEIRLPVNAFDSIVGNQWRPTVFKGLLAVIVISRVFPASRKKICDIWIMNEYGVVKSWTKRFAIPITLEDTLFVRPLGITKNDQLLLDLDGKLLWYDLDCQQGWILGFHGVQGSFDADTLTESLYLLEAIRE